jgi:hypothetical protein
MSGENESVGRLRVAVKKLSPLALPAMPMSEGGENHRADQRYREEQHDVLARLRINSQLDHAESEQWHCPEGDKELPDQRDAPVPPGEAANGLADQIREGADEAAEQPGLGYGLHRSARRQWTRFDEILHVPHYPAALDDADANQLIIRPEHHGSVRRVVQVPVVDVRDLAGGVRAARERPDVLAFNGPTNPRCIELLPDLVIVGERPVPGHPARMSFGDCLDALVDGRLGVTGRLPGRVDQGEIERLEVGAGHRRRAPGLSCRSREDDGGRG